MTLLVSRSASEWWTDHERQAGYGVESVKQKGRLAMVTKLLLSALVLALGISLSACSVKVEGEWFGKTGKDDRTVTPEFYGQKQMQGKY